MYLLEQLLQYYIFVADPVDDDVFYALRSLVAAVVADRETRVVRIRGKPQLPMEREQLPYNWLFLRSRKYCVFLNVREY